VIRKKINYIVHYITIYKRKELYFNTLKLTWWCHVNVFNLHVGLF